MAVLLKQEAVVNLLQVSRAHRQYHCCSVAANHTDCAVLLSYHIIQLNAIFKAQLVELLISCRRCCTSKVSRCARVKGLLLSREGAKLLTVLAAQRLKQTITVHTYNRHCDLLDNVAKPSGYYQPQPWSPVSQPNFNLQVR